MFVLSHIPDSSSKTVETGKIRAEIFCCIFEMSRYSLTLVKCTSLNVQDIHKNIVHINFKSRDKKVEINSNISINHNKYKWNKLVKSKVTYFLKNIAL